MDSLYFVTKIDSLRENCTKNKTIPLNFETEILTALSFYPELSDTRIEFREAKIKASLNARPTVGSLIFRKRANRRYIIRIKPTNGDSIATLGQVGFNGAVGVLGHELNHLVDYSQRGFFRMLGRLFSYTNKKGKKRFEAEIDRMTIAKGLGWQLYDWEDFIFNRSKATNKYKAYKKAIYYSPEELGTLIKASQEKE